MEIDITRFFNDSEPYDFSGSVAERGANAGKETWANALKEGTDSPILSTPEQFEALREYVQGFGAWEEEEIAGWNEAECNALFIQLISGDIREMESLCHDDSGEFDWGEVERLQYEGVISSNLFRSNEKIYYYLGN